MKSIFLAFAIVAISLIALAPQAAAQEAAPVLIEDFVPGLSSQLNNTGSEAINQRAVKNFQKTFKEIIHAEWSKTIDGGYVAHFEKNTVKTSVAYNGKGVWNHTIRRYAEKQLPEDVRKRVKSIYYDYTISSVIEINFENQVVYLVYAHDETAYKTIRVSYEEVLEVESFEK